MLQAIFEAEFSAWRITGTRKLIVKLIRGKSWWLVSTEHPQFCHWRLLGVMGSTRNETIISTTTLVAMVPRLFFIHAVLLYPSIPAWSTWLGLPCYFASMSINPLYTYWTLTLVPSSHTGHIRSHTRIISSHVPHTIHSYFHLICSHASVWLLPVTEQRQKGFTSVFRIFWIGES